MASLTSNPKVQLAATAVVSAAIAAGAILSYQRLQQDDRVSRLKRSIPQPSGSDDDDHAAQSVTRIGPLPKPDKEDEHNQALAHRAQNGDFDDELILEQLARNRVFLGDAGLAALRAAFVVIVGCGGVGSHACAALARSGLARVRLVDFDQVTLSSLNRHAVATLADVGLPKVQCLQRRLVAVTPWVRFDLRLQKFEGAVADVLLGGWEGDEGQRPDFVIDAIDNIESKVELLKYCHDQGLPVISAMGAGTKSDPTRVMVGDIGASFEDGLSRATRRRLKLQGVTSGIPVVYSTEKMGEGKAALLPLAEAEFQKGSVGDLGVLPDFRVRILPVLGTMPAVFGYTVANHVILKISGYPMDYQPAKARDKMYEAIVAYVQASEEKIVRMIEGGRTDVCIGLKVPITPGDIAFLVEEAFRGRSAITGIPTKLMLIRWKKPEETTLVRIGEGSTEQRSSNLRLRDLVCLTKEEAVRHQKKVLHGDKTLEDLYSREVIELVEARQQEAEAYERHR
ncbi:tRNA threonylcarbamoyladenosine dehydratase 2 [Chaetomidium leptoderma]|uniref:tRNA threonylcarbamoyladenosine dehydratase 2 n=1 Tax=Chaetomidium leptoderma TaxID=669021 RepID=A0AAN6ZV53_9PEZI|nr:tRNA threonylcarbamoyladenosine dehydratase 2 [Chaetomidium leptoderma]